jgi:flagellar hook-length control protein FliK
VRGAEAAELDGTAAQPVEATATFRPVTPGETGDGAVALARGLPGQGANNAAESAAGDPGALALRTSGRMAGGAADAALSESGPGAPGRAHGPGAGAHRPGDDAAASSGVLDPGALGLRSVSAAAATAGAMALASEGGRTTEGIGAVQAGSATSAPNPGALAAAWANPAAAADAAGAAGTVQEAGLRAAPGSEAFARELGAQVSVFVREGVQQARLHLNPQELGPVLVRIQLEGQAAQVHMAAELPQTRQALEQALPALAGQLSEAGITLTGGGVFERPPQGFAEREARGDEAARSAAFSGSAAAGTAPSVAAAGEPGRWSRARGLVDLIA